MEEEEETEYSYVTTRKMWADSTKGSRG